MKDGIPVDSWVLRMMDTSKGSAKKNVNELLGEAERTDFRSKEKYIHQYGRRGREKLKRNEMQGKDQLTSLFTLEVDKTILQQTEMQAAITARLDDTQDADREDSGCCRVASISPIRGMNKKP